MSKATKQVSIASKILKTENVDWQSFHYVQGENFKELSDTDRQKLGDSMVKNQFCQPFKVWFDKKANRLYCLDGRHRTLILEELISNGVKVPEQLPATFIDCKNIKEAARLVLVYSSVYAKITEEGFTDFVSTYGLDTTDLSLTINIPDLKFEDIPEMVDPFLDEGTEVKNQYGVIVMCKSEKEQERMFKKLTGQGLTCKVVVT